MHCVLSVYILSTIRAGGRRAEVYLVPGIIYFARMYVDRYLLDNYLVCCKYHHQLCIVTGISK